VTRVLIAAGASGGHVYPALATAEVLRERGHDVEFAGGDRLEAQVVPEAGFPFHGFKVRRPPSVRRELLMPHGIRAIASIGIATLRASRLLRRVRPDVVLGMGGFAGVPVTLAAARARLPLVLHEQNAHLSFAQRIPLRRATVLAMGLPIEEKVEHARMTVVGNPVRGNIVALAKMSDDERTRLRPLARQRLDLDPSAKTLFVLGGSLGSGPLNEVVPTLGLPDDVQVLHAAGRDNVDAVTRAWAATGTGTRVRVVGFIDTMEDAYASADLVVSRSGALAVSELALAGLPSVLVPIETLARGDQEANARVLERAGGAVVVMQSSPDFAGLLGENVARLLGDDAARTAMATAARSIAKPDAAANLADVVESLTA
jgi:UDP-N-acetylglucosamine--N-acetylmuramyl-(pentapeptide) pyrophosphoryl-undecaprenol N-acetylglucosamine transferase